MKKMDVEYKINLPINVSQFIELLTRSGLAERRPIEDKVCLRGMIENSNLIVSAWRSDELIGIARCMTDFHYACYLSDLAVSREYQNVGVGKKLQTLAQEQLGEKCKLILLAAPGVDSYYEDIGFDRHERCWVLDAESKLNA